MPHVLWQSGRGPPPIGCRSVVLVAMRDHEIGDLEDHIAGTTIADGYLVARAKPIEYRKTYAIERHFQPPRRLPSMRMRDQQIAMLFFCKSFQIFEVTNENLLGPDSLDHLRLSGRHGDGHLRAHIVQHAG